MRTAMLIIPMLCVGLFVQAQSISAPHVQGKYSDLWRKEIDTELCIYADVAYIRDSPSPSGNLVDSLSHGHRVKIISEPIYVTKNRSFAWPWQKISFLKQGTTKEGYICNSLLTINNDTDAHGTHFLHGIQRKIPSTNTIPEIYILEIKALDKDLLLINKDTIHIELQGRSLIENKLFGSMGLRGLQSIHRIGFLGEACAIWTTRYYFGWNGKQFFKLPSRSSMADAAEFYHSEIILFPLEHKLADNIIFKDTEIGEAIDAMATDVQFKTTRKREKYTWDGKRFTLQTN